MWLVYALLTTLAWACADLFYKKGAVESDKMSHVKTVIMVGLVMGIHAIFYMFSNDIAFSFMDIITYSPVSFLYILSMAIGYLGLRYIELSISSPVQNSSGAVTAILIYIFFSYELSIVEVLSICIITFGIIGLGVLEQKESNSSRMMTAEDKKYRMGFKALIFPIFYAVFDGLGTFADAIYLDELSLIGEDQALLAYEFTFLIVAILGLIYLAIKKEKFTLLEEKDRGIAAIFETIGQFFYVFAMSRNAIIVAPLIASYSVFSVLLSRIFLKEKLSNKKYIVIGIVMIGVALLAIAEYL